MLKTALLVLAFVGMLLAAVGCGTVEGMGRDISKVGGAISEAARDIGN